MMTSESTDPGAFGVLEESECYALLHEGVIGRIAFTGPRLMVLPITYTWIDGRIVFRTSPASSLANLVGQDVVFELDDLDIETGVGWSLVVEGRVENCEPELAAELRPWASGERSLALAIRPRSVSGRTVSRPEGV